MSWSLLHLRPSDGGTGEVTRRLVSILLGFLLLWSLALRIWFATPGLDANRFWDERYGLENVASLLHGNGLRPANGFHPSLSYLPQAAVLGAAEQLHRVTGLEALAVLGDRGIGFTPTAYFLCRSTQALFGMLSLYVVFVIGRRLGGAWTGLLAAFFLSVVPWHIRQSVIYKPDILLVLTVLVAFYLSLRALDRPTLGRYLAAGVGIGMALASKFNAGPVAVPLMIATLSGKRRHLLLWLILAGLASVAIFVLLNPYTLLEPEIYRRSFSRTLYDYSWKGSERAGASRLFLLGHAVRSLLSGSFHGPLIGAAGLVGLLLIAGLAVRDWRSRAAASWLLVPSYVAAYVLLYALVSTNPSAHNWLPLSPFLALAAAWLIRRLYGILSSRFPGLSGVLPATVMGALLVVPLAWQAQRFVYRGVVPTTAELAAVSLRPRFRRATGRVVFSEVSIVVRARRDRQRIASAQVDSLARVQARALNRADAEIFAEDRLAETVDAEFYRSRMRRVPDGSLVFVRPRMFEARGPALVVIPHPLRPRGTLSGEWRVSARDRRLYEPQLEIDFKATALVSVEFALPADQTDGSTVTLLASNRPYSAFPVMQQGRWVRYTSQRFPVGSGPELRLARAITRDRVPFVLQRWRKPRH